jgi:hypothetical protein
MPPISSQDAAPLQCYPQSTVNNSPVLTFNLTMINGYLLSTVICHCKSITMLFDGLASTTNWDIIQLYIL